MKNYAYFQPIKGRIHVADPEKIYLGECFTDNATGMKISMVIYLVIFNYILQLTSH